jgi:hypothetical protein
MLEDRPAVAELCDGTLTLTLTLRQAQEVAYKHRLG